MSNPPSREAPLPGSVHNEARSRPTLEHRVSQRIGQLQRIPAGASGPVRLLQVTGDDFRPWLVTCTISAQYATGMQAPPAAGTSFPNLIARVNFGVDGISQQAFLHVSRGIQFTTPLTALDLDVFRILDPDPLVNGEVEIRGQLSYGAHPAGHQQPVFESVAAFPAVPPGPAAEVVLPIAPFTRAFSLLSDDLSAFTGATALAIEALDSAPTPNVLARYAPTVPFNSQPLPANASQLRLLSPAGAPARVVRAVYELAL